MSDENSNTFQPSEVTQALRDQYLSLRLTDDQARAILANATTHVVIKPSQLDSDPGSTHS